MHWNLLELHDMTTQNNTTLKTEETNEVTLGVLPLWNGQQYNRSRA